MREKYSEREPTSGICTDSTAGDLLCDGQSDGKANQTGLTHRGLAAGGDSVLSKKDHPPAPRRSLTLLSLAENHPTDTAAAPARSPPATRQLFYPSRSARGHSAAQHVSPGANTLTHLLCPVTFSSRVSERMGHVILILLLPQAQTLRSRVQEHSECCVLWVAAMCRLHGRGGGISEALAETIVSLTLQGSIFSRCLATRSQPTLGLVAS